MPGFEVPDHVRPIRDQVLAFVRERVEPAEPTLHAGGEAALTLIRDLQRQAKAEGLWALGQRTDPASPIYGMPILDVVNSKNTIVIKRGKGTGFAGIENALFYADNTRMLYGDGSEMANALVSELKALDGGH